MKNLLEKMVEDKGRKHFKTLSFDILQKALSVAREYGLRDNGSYNQEYTFSDHGVLIIAGVSASEHKWATIFYHGRQVFEGYLESCYLSNDYAERAGYDFKDKGLAEGSLVKAMKLKVYAYDGGEWLSYLEAMPHL